MESLRDIYDRWLEPIREQQHHKDCPRHEDQPVIAGVDPKPCICDGIVAEALETCPNLEA